MTIKNVLNKSDKSLYTSYWDFMRYLPFTLHLYDQILSQSEPAMRPVCSITNHHLHGYTGIIISDLHLILTFCF